MGRRQKAAKAEDKDDANEIPNLPVESMNNLQTSLNSLPSKKKGSPNMNMVTRRSGRLRNMRSPVPNQEMTVEEIHLADSEQDEEPFIEQFNTAPPCNQESFEAKIDFLVQSVKEFKSQGTKRPFPSESESIELKYRSLYIDSQKKIEALTEENHQLAKNLEFAKGKAEALEQMIGVLGSLKEMAFITNLGKASEAMMNLSSQAATAKFNMAEATAHGSPAQIAAEENKAPYPVTHKRYARKKK